MYQPHLHPPTIVVKDPHSIKILSAMVFGNPWNEHSSYEKHDQNPDSYDKHYQYFLIHLAPKGICKVLLPGTLAAVGFGAGAGGGVAAGFYPFFQSKTTILTISGTVAASWQAMYGGTIASGGIFSVLQSAGAGGLGLKTLESYCEMYLVVLATLPAAAEGKHPDDARSAAESCAAIGDCRTGTII